MKAESEVSQLEELLRARMKTATQQKIDAYSMQATMAVWATLNWLLGPDSCEQQLMKVLDEEWDFAKRAKSLGKQLFGGNHGE